MKQLLKGRKPSPALVVGILALSVALVGTAVAGPIAEISLTKQEKKQTRKIASGVSNKLITKRAPGLSVASANLAALANAVANNTVGSAQLADAGVTTDDLADAAVTLAKLANNSVDGNKVVDESLLASDLGPNSVNSSEIATNAVGATEVASNAIDSDEVVNGGLDAVDVGSVTGSENIDFGSIAANDCATEIIDTNVNLENDVILVSVDQTVVYANGGLSVHATSSNVADFIRVNVCNVTAAPINPASANFRYVVFRR